jgi:branched-chain amino acid transport system ATP-binding protein
MKTNDTHLLHASGIVMQFGGLKALNDIDVMVKENEVLGVIGPNGSGKTTFFNVITGIYTPTAGTIRFAGQNLAGLKPQEIARLGILRTFQNSRLWNELSILDNLLLGMWLKPRPGLFSALFKREELENDFLEKIDRAVSLARIFNEELAKNPYRLIKELPLVDRRRIEICRALLADPHLLLLDEPSAGMDHGETQELMDDIKKIKESRERVGIIIIEHDMSVISRIAERVVAFNFGKKIAEGSFDEVKMNTEVKEAYLGKEYVGA